MRLVAFRKRLKKWNEMRGGVFYGCSNRFFDDYCDCGTALEG